MSYRDRLILAIDTPDYVEAVRIADASVDLTYAIKIGSILYAAIGMAFLINQFCYVQEARRIFLDLKLHDTPRTVAGAMREIAHMRPWMVSIHALGGIEMMRAAKEAISEETSKFGGIQPLVIAVTCLTSLDVNDLSRLGITSISVQGLVCNLAVSAKAAGLDGVVCAGSSVESVKALCGDDFITVVPGIVSHTCKSPYTGQKMTTHVYDAINGKADYLVIGSGI